MADLDELKRKRDQLTARIQAAEAREKAGRKKEEDRVKVLVGAAILDHLKRHGRTPPLSPAELVTLMDGFLKRPSERVAVLGEEGRGSAALHRLAASEATSEPPKPQPDAGLDLSRLTT